MTGMEFYEMDRSELIRCWWERYRVAMQDEKGKDFFTENSKKPYQTQNFAWSYLFPGIASLGLHQSMFTASLKGLASDEQREHYLPQADYLNIIGCYAQTELSHGSNVAGLETTATFDVESESFTIHSPTIRAAKFWPGALGM